MLQSHIFTLNDLDSFLASTPIFDVYSTLLKEALGLHQSPPNGYALSYASSPAR